MIKRARRDLRLSHQADTKPCTDSRRDALSRKGVQRRLNTQRDTEYHHLSSITGVNIYTKGNRVYSMSDGTVISGEGAPCPIGASANNYFVEFSSVLLAPTPTASRSPLALYLHNGGRSSTIAALEAAQGPFQLDV
jgi:hypothetical protein